MHWPLWQISPAPHGGLQTFGLMHWPLLQISGEMHAGTHSGGGVQTPFVHDKPISHSVLVLQPWPAGHLFGQEPPQSTPVSIPFFIPSVQLDGVTQTPFWHVKPVWQSLFVEQPLPDEHLFGQEPPQSIPVSVPSLTPLAQLVGGVPQTPFVHVNPVWQSVLEVQPWPDEHLLGQFPPQSIPVSNPFFWPSVQLPPAAWPAA